MPISKYTEATIEVRFKDIDPDSGRINQDECICLVQHPDDGVWICSSLIKDNPFENREFYVFDPKNKEVIYGR